MSENTATEPKLKEVAGVRGPVKVHHWHNHDAKVLVFIAHGFGEHARRYDHVVAALAQDGADVTAPDHWGHGLTGGDRALVDDIDVLVQDFATVVDDVVEKHPGHKVVVIGHSMGGIIATLFAQSHPGKLDALVLSGPVIGGNPDMFALLDMDPIPDVPIDPAALSRDPAVGEDYMSDELVYHGALRRETLEAFKTAVQEISEGPPIGVPTLWIHGEEDPLAPVSATRPALEAIRPDDLEEHVYEGARHEIFNETNKDEVIGHVRAFIARVL